MKKIILSICLLALVAGSFAQQNLCLPQNKKQQKTRSNTAWVCI
jgi:hypothetical protein